MNKQQLAFFGGSVVILALALGIGMVQQTQQLSGDVIGASRTVNGDEATEEDARDPNAIVVTIDGQDYTQAELDALLAQADEDEDAETSSSEAEEPDDLYQVGNDKPLVCTNKTKAGAVSGYGESTNRIRTKPTLLEVTYFCAKADAEASAERIAEQQAKTGCDVIRNAVDRCEKGCLSNLLPTVFTITNTTTVPTMVSTDPAKLKCPQNKGWKATSTINATCSVTRECKVPPPRG